MNTDRTGITNVNKREPLQERTEVTAPATNQEIVMARVRERFGVGHR